MMSTEYISEHFQLEFELGSKYDELDHFRGTPVWKDSEFSANQPTSWFPKSHPDNAKQHLDTLHELLVELAGDNTTKLPKHIGPHTFLIPIEERKEPLFMALTPATLTWLMEESLNRCCQRCGEEVFCRAFSEHTRWTDFSFVFPVPWRDLPEVPQNAADLASDMTYFLCKPCLDERFASVDRYRGIDQHGKLHREHLITTIDYLPYKTIFGVDILSALAANSKPKRFNWQLPQPADAYRYLPLFNGFYTVKKYVKVKRAKHHEKVIQ